MSVQTADNGALRDTAGKPRYDLLPPDAIHELVRVLTFGAEKYAARNWERGMAWSKCVARLKRHMHAFETGETHDPESGCLHVAHVMWNAMALTTYALRGIGERDMPFMEPSAAPEGAAARRPGSGVWSTAGAMLDAFEVAVRQAARNGVSPDADPQCRHVAAAIDDVAAVRGKLRAARTARAMYQGALMAPRSKTRKVGSSVCRASLFEILGGDNTSR